jgi:hypothetical protein
MEGPTFLVVHCCASDRSRQYLFEPVVTTLLVGAELAAVGWTVQDVMLANVTRAAAFPEKIARLTARDIIVCVGLIGCATQPW